MKSGIQVLNALTEAMNANLHKRIGAREEKELAVMQKIGILEDDAALRRELKYFLETNGYEVQLFLAEEYADGTEEELLAAMAESGCHLLLLDIGLPGFDGLHLLRAFCSSTEIPVIMITSQNTELVELMSIHNGADDFLTKPFAPQLLLAHMEAVMKRVYKETKAQDVRRVISRKEEADSREFILELSKGRIVCGEKQAELSKNELQLLQVLVKKQGEIVSRDELMNALWDNCMFVDDNTLTVNVTRLKGKLESIGVAGAIATKRGMGYQLL